MASPEQRGDGVNPDKLGEIDKSLLVLSEPRRIRDPEHLKLVADQPCLICGRASPVKPIICVTLNHEPWAAKPPMPTLCRFARFIIANCTHEAMRMPSGKRKAATPCQPQMTSGDRAGLASRSEA